ncbi:MAG: hypothetical protein N3A71_00010 [Candidatus Dojkabacteria bacterium]|nr:hypothetical protein [Candidatus Dojkabacteria bacterium]
MDHYSAIADFMLSYGFWITCCVIIIGMIFIFGGFYLWFDALMKAYKNYEDTDRNLWLTLLIGSTLLTPATMFIVAVLYKITHKED